MPRGARCRGGFAALVVTLPVLSGCGQLQFRNDHRLHFIAPADLQKVSLPMTLTWTMKGFTPTGADGATSKTSGYYAVFVDQAPVQPGHTIRSLFTGDRACRIDPKCPTSDQLLARNIYTTDTTRLTVTRVGPLPPGTGRKIHTFTVVLMDGTGHRIGEAAWERDVEIPQSPVAS